MLKLPLSLRTWPGEAFASTLQAELEALDKTRLPLQQGLKQSSHVGTAPFNVLLIGTHEDPEAIHTRVGVFYTGIIAGCSCADDPTPVDEIREYCELSIDIDKHSGEARIAIVD